MRGFNHGWLEPLFFLFITGKGNVIPHYAL
jgi:hypothetical protein